MPVNDALTFRVWAPDKKEMVLHIVAPYEQEFPMTKNEWGYFDVTISSSENHLQYYFKPDSIKNFPDPGSHYQPEGVHGPSQIVNHSTFVWTDNNWKGISLHELVLYEVHVGTFTPEGTFQAIIPRLNDLKNTGINALELMPVTAFPGERNWGYDSVYPYAVQHSYGGPEGLKKLVDACHSKGIAVFLDVVYNHLGPEGNYFSEYGPYFTKTYTTPWGDALNYDGAWSDGVREFFADTITHWMENYHIDGLRCDAIHTVFDNGAVHFWELAVERVNKMQKKFGRNYHLIAESDLNSPKVIRPVESGGYAFDAQWLDDFHHALYKIINPSDTERYYDFGSIDQLCKAYKEGFVHSGEWVKYRKRKYGASSSGISGDKFVVFNGNHDQAGNRAGGERLSMLVNTARLKVAAAALLLAPYIPMLFMGEEYGDDTPFYYFVSHSEEHLIEAVRNGRKAEFEEFGFGEDVPDPQDEQTFTRSGIHWEKRNTGHYKDILDWHTRLLKLRSDLPALRNFNKNDLSANVINEQAMELIRTSIDKSEKLVCLFNFSDRDVVYESAIEGLKILDSTDKHPERIIAGAVCLLPESVVVYRQKDILG